MAKTKIKNCLYCNGQGYNVFYLEKEMDFAKYLCNECDGTGKKKKQSPIRKRKK